MDTKTHYDVLGVSPTAPDSIIKAAHRTLAKELHPDRPGGDSEKFADINRAADILLDADARARYDAELEAARTPDPEPAYAQGHAEPVPEVVWEDVTEVYEPAEPEYVAPSRLSGIPGWARVTAAALPVAVIVGTPLIASTKGLVTAVIAGIVVALGWARITRPAWALLVVVTGVVLVAGPTAPRIIPMIAAWVGLSVVTILNQEADNRG